MLWVVCQHLPLLILCPNLSNGSLCLPTALQPSLQYDGNDTHHENRGICNVSLMILCKITFPKRGATQKCKNKFLNIKWLTIMFNRSWKHPYYLRWSIVTHKFCMAYIARRQNGSIATLLNAIVED